ncbi:MAG: NYN domain-containing protein [Syntrophales bacterium]|nr:NYN domain-containing protein [Syntrophales bacterium]
MRIIIDGYNMIRQSMDLARYERSSLEAGRKALIRLLSNYRTVRPHRITVVFDGWGGGEPEEMRDLQMGIEIVYSPLGKKADDVIKHLVTKLGEEVLVVTSDREIATYVQRHGKSAINSHQFEDIIRQRISSRSYISFPTTEVDREDRPLKAKKKGPSHRLSKKEKELRKLLNQL